MAERRSVPWRELLAVLGVAAIVLLAYRDVAFGGKTFDTSARGGGINGWAPPTGFAGPTAVDGYRVDPGASAWQTVPWAQVVHRELKAGEVPYWNPYQGAGEPLAGNILSDVFDPLTLAINLHPTTLVWDVSFLIAFVLGGCVMFLFLRNLELSQTAAIAGAAAFALCGYFAMDSNNSFARVYIYLPILFLTIDRTAASAKIRWVAAMAAAVAGTILAGMPESSFFVLGAGGLYGLYRVIFAGPGRRRWAGMRLGLAAVAGLALAAPLLVAFLGYLPLTFNTHAPGVGLASASRGALLQQFIPLVDGPPAHPRAPIAGARGWVGAAIPLLCVVAAACPRAMRRRGGWLLLAVGVVLLLKIYNFPGVQWLGSLPLANRTNFVAFAPPVAAFGLVAVGAIGLHGLMSGDVRWPLLVAGILLAGAVLAGLVLGPARAYVQAPSPSAWRQYVLAGAAAGAVLAAAAASVFVARLRGPAGVLAALAVVVEVFVLFPQGIYMPRTDPFRTPPWFALVAPGGKAPVARVFGFTGLLYPDTSGALGLQDVEVLGALYPTRYVTFVRDFVSTSFTDRFTGQDMTVSDVVANPAFDLLGVRYVLGPPGWLDRQPGYEGLGSAGVAEVYQNDAALPRAFVATDLLAVGSMAQAEAALKSLGSPAPGGTIRFTRFDPARQAIVEPAPGAGVPASAPGAQEGSPRAVRIVSYRADTVTLEVPPGPAGLLVLTDTWLPGWTATVNGKTAPMYPTDLAFRGVPVGSGAARVVLSYRPPHEGTALLLPALAVVGLGAAALWMRRRRPTRAPVHSPADGHTA